MSFGPEIEWLAAARAAMEIEADSIRRASARLDGELIRAVDLVLAHPGKVIVTGIGKSGHIARKIVATLCSTGTAAVFLHPAEAVHGDLGIYTPGDPTVLISNRGTSAELQALVPLLRQFRSPLIGILGNLASPLASQMDVLLAAVEREAYDMIWAARGKVTARHRSRVGYRVDVRANFTPRSLGGTILRGNWGVICG
jgi:arabinose-5-phosphate isomerase